ncbi:speckle-type POZ protein [Nephila pilipes]|uniref:Speckle-type POZ protein n=1 Tax=Nephila pilipes TaxID=299642 RepID=A0A8X6INK0_NEPPI|nr:speckle-type POZ protein [Nephila pilipes]
MEFEAPFTYIWTIENYPQLDFNGQIFSPYFEVGYMKEIEWYVELHAAHNLDLFECVLSRTVNDKLESIEMEFEFAILSPDGSPWIEKTNRYTFENGTSFIVNEFELSDNFSERKAEFLPMKTVTIRCRMWSVETNISHTGLWMARTRLETDCISFIWPIEDFNTLETSEKRWHTLKFSFNGFNPRMELCLYFAENRMRIKIINIDFTGEFHLSWRISLVGAEGKIRGILKGFDYMDSDHNKTYDDSFSLETLRSHKSYFFPYDAICLKYEFEAFIGDLWSRIEYQTSGVQGEKREQIYCSTKRLASCCPLKISVKEFHDDDSLVDVNFRVDNQVFPAHKVILGAQSLVFKDMFASEIRETRTIDIPGVKSQTFRILMKYFYTDTLPDLDWESALELYKMARKYKILGLLKECTIFLKQNLSFSNLCDVIKLASFHDGKDRLQKAAMKLYLKRDIEILNSDAWKTLKQENPREALEVLESIYIKKFKTVRM